jgi:predicted site-specific integrase-resolvase
MRVREAAALAGLNPSTIYSWVREGKIDSHEISNVIHVDLEQVKGAKQRYRKNKEIPVHPQGLMSLGDAAAQTGITIRTLQRWAKAGRIKAELYHGTRWYIDVEEAKHLKATLKRGPKPGRGH